METPDNNGNGWPEHRLHVEKSLERLERGQENVERVINVQGEQITLIRLDIGELKARRRLIKSAASFIWGLFT